MSERREEELYEEVEAEFDEDDVEIEVEEAAGAPTAWDKASADTQRLCDRVSDVSINTFHI